MIKPLKRLAGLILMFPMMAVGVSLVLPLMVVYGADDGSDAAFRVAFFGVRLFVDDL